MPGGDTSFSLIGEKGTPKRNHTILAGRGRIVGFLENCISAGRGKA